ncbi:hypothetical protein ACUN7V_16140 [Quadrisphaera oryzae]|uniref:hypothetical protein n=1 Tax=Quadrisphaera TaxID=317661 RepID=UPI001644AFAF|nr:hypothetical protein [Quadrisphaera sp. RL12-1S]MBC3763555.1 hypothetical protein [Quadrisphaera sp. RL12-1S]
MSTPERPSRRHAGTDADPCSDADTVAHTADRRLRRMGVGRADRSAIVETLHTDLRAAQADGRRPADLLGPDLDDFLRRTLAEGGHTPDRPGAARLALVGTAVAVPAVVVASSVVWSGLVPLFTATVSPLLHLPHTGVAGGWVGVGLVSFVAALAALWLLVRGRTGARPTVAAGAVTLLVAAAAGIGCNLVVLQQGWRITPASISLQVASALVPLALALLAARWWGLRRAAGAGSDA